MGSGMVPSSWRLCVGKLAAPNQSLAAVAAWIILWVAAGFRPVPSCCTSGDYNRLTSDVLLRILMAGFVLLAVAWVLGGPKWEAKGQDGLL